jgi:hypothetical protein
MARWGLCWGFGFGAAAFVAAIAAMRWLDGGTAWAAWGACVVCSWGAVMALYSFDRPAPAGHTPPAGRRGPRE